MSNRGKYATFYGGHTDAPVGYCYYHRKHLTVRQLKKRDCLARQCPSLKQCREHPYWEQREQKKTCRTQRRDDRNKQYVALTAGKVGGQNSI